MRFTRLLPVLALVCLFAVSTRAQQQITVIATMVDPATSQASASLNPEEVRLTEDGAPLKVLKVAAVDRTVKAQLLIDNGVGMGNNLSMKICFSRTPSRSTCATPGRRSSLRTTRCCSNQ